MDTGNISVESTVCWHFKWHWLLWLLTGNISTPSVCDWFVQMSTGNTWGTEPCKKKHVKHKLLFSAAPNPQDGSNCFTVYPLADLFTRTTSQLLWAVSSHMAVNAQRLSARYTNIHHCGTVCSQISTTVCSLVFIHTAEWIGANESRVTTFAQGLTWQHRIRIWSGFS